MNWEQFRTILWLRWRLTRNQFGRGGQLNAVLSMFVLAMMLASAAGIGFGGLVLGAFLGKKIAPQVLLLAWDGVIFFFLVFWLTGLMVEIQRSESIDIPKLLHLPVKLRQVFFFNYLASHLTPSIVLLLPGIIGLCVGLIFSGGLLMGLMLPVALTFLFMITSWTYCLRGWLAGLMINKRKRRAVLVWITVIFVLLSQVPNLLFNSPIFHHRHQPKPAQRTIEGPEIKRPNVPDIFIRAHPFVPPGWPGYSAMELRDGNVLPALGATAAALIFGALGLMTAYRMTIRFYLGAEGAMKVHPIQRPKPAAGPRKPLLVERSLPWLPDDTGALTLATFRSLARAPELRMAFIMPLVFGVIMSSVYFSRPRQALPDFLTAMAATAAVIVAAFSTTPTMSNAFGLDRNGFRALILLPIRRDHVLLAKNLAFFPFTAAVSLVFLILAKLLVHVPWGTFVAALIEVPTASLLFSLVCNLASILAPYRLAHGTLQARKPKPIMFVAMFATMLLTPIVLMPIVIPAALQLLCSKLGWVPWLPVNVLSAAAIFVGIAWLYRWLLPLEGRLLQNREQTILREVTEEWE